MKEPGNIFEQEIEVPEVVLRKMDQAFCSIKKESKSSPLSYYGLLIYTYYTRFSYFFTIY